MSELRGKIAECADKLIRIEISRLKPGRGNGYMPIGKVDRIPDDMDERTFDPSEAADACFKMASASAEEHGKALFLFVGFVVARGPNGEKQAFQVRAKIGDDGDEEETPSVDAVKMLGAARQMMMDLHGCTLKLLEKCEAMANTVITMASSVADGASKNNATLIEAVKLDLEFREKQMQQEAETEAHKTNAETIKSVIENIGKPFADRMKDVFGDAVAEKFGLGRGPMAKRLAALLDGLTDEQRSQLEQLFGDDEWSLIKGAARATDDGAFREVFGRVIELWKTQGQAAAQAKLAKVAQIIGPKIAGFVKLLEEMGIRNEG